MPTKWDSTETGQTGLSRGILVKMWFTLLWFTLPPLSQSKLRSKMPYHTLPPSYFLLEFIHNKLIYFTCGRGDYLQRTQNTLVEIRPPNFNIFLSGNGPLNWPWVKYFIMPRGCEMLIETEKILIVTIVKVFQTWLSPTHSDTIIIHLQRISWNRLDNSQSYSLVMQRKAIYQPEMAVSGWRIRQEKIIWW